MLYVCRVLVMFPTVIQYNNSMHTAQNWFQNVTMWHSYHTYSSKNLIQTSKDIENIRYQINVILGERKFRTVWFYYILTLPPGGGMILTRQNESDKPLASIPLIFCNIRNNLSLMAAYPKICFYIQFKNRKGEL